MDWYALDTFWPADLWVILCIAKLVTMCFIAELEVVFPLQFISKNQRMCLQKGIFGWECQFSDVVLFRVNLGVETIWLLLFAFSITFPQFPFLCSQTKLPISCSTIRNSSHPRGEKMSNVLLRLLLKNTERYSAQKLYL